MAEDLMYRLFIDGRWVDARADEIVAFAGVAMPLSPDDLGLDLAHDASAASAAVCDPAIRSDPTGGPRNAAPAMSVGPVPSAGPDCAADWHWAGPRSSSRHSVGAAVNGSVTGLTHHPRRSLLFVPGNDDRKLQRAATAGADVVVLDLEDGVAPAAKEQAREVVRRALADISYGTSERLVRLNAEPEQMARDLEVAATADGLLIPKIDGPAELERVRSVALRVLGRVPTLVVLFGETPRGVLAATSMVSWPDDVDAWMWGSEDLAAATGCRPRGARESFEGPLALARSATVLLAAATSTDAIDTVYPFHRDLEGLRIEAEEAAALGFSGKAVIHPDQVSPVNDAFTPDDAAVTRALAIVEAFGSGSAVVTLENQMLDAPHLRAARRLLSRAGL